MARKAICIFLLSISSFLSADERLIRLHQQLTDIDVLTIMNEDHVKKIDALGHLIQEGKINQLSDQAQSVWMKELDRICQELQETSTWLMDQLNVSISTRQNIS